MRELPRPVVVLAALLIMALLAINIVADIFRADYEGYATTIILGGLLGGVLGVDRAVRRTQPAEPPAPPSLPPAHQDDEKAGA